MNLHEQNDVLRSAEDMYLTGAITADQFREVAEAILASDTFENIIKENEDKDTQQGIRYRKGYEDGIMDLDPQADDGWYLNGHRDGLGDRDLSLHREELEQAEAQEEINEWLKWREKRNA